MSWFDWIEKAAPTILNLGATVFEGSQKASANKKAEQEAATATKQAQEAREQSLNRALGIVQESQLKNQALQDQASPGLSQQQLAIAQQNTMTPAQQQALEEATRQAVMRMGMSRLRGSGRATTASVKDVQGTLRNQYMEANRNRADNAASNLSNMYMTASGREDQLSGTAANLQQGIGNTRASAIEDIGRTRAGVTTANADIYGQMAGDIAGQLSGTQQANTRALNTVIGEIKEEDKERYKSRYINPN